MSNIVEWMLENKIATTGIQGGNIAAGLTLFGLPRDEQQKRCLLYRKWRPKTNKRNEIPPWQAYQLAIAGIDPDDVQPRQIDLFEVTE